MMNKNKIYDLLIVVLIYIGMSCFPVNLFGIGKLGEILISIALQVFVFGFILLFNKKSTVKIDIPIKNRNNTLILLPVFILCFSNFSCLIVPESHFEFCFSLEILLSIVLSLMVSINEEIIFRCILMGNFFKEKHSLIRVIICAGIFAVCHLTHFLSSFNPEALVVVLYTFGIGIVLGLIYLFAGNFVFCVLFHFLFNVINNDVSSNMLVLVSDYRYYLINAIVALIGGVYLFVIYKLALSKREKSELL